MAIESKALFLRDLEQKLGTTVTASDMQKILALVAESLDGFAMTGTGKTDVEEDDLLKAFLVGKKVQGLSPKTIERYEYIIGRMMDVLKIHTRKITVYHLRSYLAGEKERGISDRTLESTREIINAYFNWLQREGLIASNPAANLGPIKYEKVEKDYYHEADLEQLKQACQSSRDLAIICFLASTGCRVSEMTQLNRDQINLQQLECKVKGKGAKERIVYLDEVAGMHISNYLKERKDSSPALFAGRASERMTPHGVRVMLKRIEKQTGVDHVHPHKFRRTLATNLIRRGMPVEEVKEILGHEKLDTTMQYIVLDKTDVKNAYRKYA